jgi:sec-independent protein translocase protein TatA
MFPQLGMMEMIVVMGVAVLLLCKRLPEVGRSLGKGIIEFKKGLRGMEDDVDLTGSSSGSSSGWGAGSVSSSRRHDDRGHSSGSDYNESSVPKFEPPTTAPVPQMEYEPQPTED